MKLKIYLIEHGISITEFAKSIGYSRSQISNIINGASKPSIRLARTIEKATNGKVKFKDGEIKACDLLSENSKPEQPKFTAKGWPLQKSVFDKESE